MTKRGGYAKGEAMRRSILEGTLKVLASDGWHVDSSLRGIARALEMAPAHILYYFPTREALLQEVILEWNESIIRELPANTDYFQGWMSLNESHRQTPGIIQLYTVLAAEAADPRHPSHDFFQKRFEETREQIAAEIRSRQAIGKIDPERDPDDIARRLIAFSDGLQLQWLFDRSIDMSQGLRDAVKDMLSPAIV